MSNSSNSNRQQLSQYLLRQNEPKQHQYSGSSPVYILSPSGGAGPEQQKPQYRGSQGNFMNESRDNYQSREQYRSMPESTAPGRSVEQQNSTGSQQSSMMIHMQYQNTMQFEQVLKRALELQESLGLNSLIHANVPPSYISKTTRTFKEVAETLIQQMNYLKERGNLTAVGVNKANENSANWLNEKVKDLELMLIEKDAQIDTLQKATRFQSSHLQKYGPDTYISPQLEQVYLQAKRTITEQQALIQKQADYINQFEMQVSSQQREIDRLRNTHPSSSKQEGSLAATQARMIEDLLKEKERSSSPMIREDGQVRQIKINNYESDELQPSRLDMWHFCHTII